MIIRFDDSKDNRTVSVSASFIENELKKIPSDYVKIYLYLTYLKSTAPGSLYSLEEIADATNVDKDIVLKALGYFEAMSDSYLSFKMDSGKKKDQQIKPQKVRRIAVRTKKEAPEQQEPKEQALPEDLSYYKHYHSELQALFGSRELTRSDYEKADEWIEVYGLPMETALYMAEYVVKTKNDKISFAYISKVAQSWAEMGLTTTEEAQDYVEFQDAKKSQAREILKAIGVYKMPSEAEKALYEKWTGKWGFSHEAILEACFDTAKTTSPSFAYLDTILHGYYKKGLFTPSDMRSARKGDSKAKEGLGEVLFELGIKSTPNKTYKEMYDKWTTEWGFSHEAILVACSKLMIEGNKTVKALDNKLKDYKDSGTTSLEMIKMQIKQKDLLEDEIRLVYQRAGLDTEVTPSARTLYTKWVTLWKLPIELVLLAAEQVISQNNKLQKIDGLLQNWRISGINTVSLAKKALSTKPAAGKAAGSAPYEQQSYSESDFSNLYNEFNDEDQ